MILKIFIFSAGEMVQQLLQRIHRGLVPSTCIGMPTSLELQRKGLLMTQASSGPELV